MSSPRTHILGTAGQATALGGLVNDDGSLHATGIGDLMTPVMAGAYTALLEKLLETFDAVDQATASASTTASVSPALPRPRPPAPTKGGDPQQVNNDSVTIEITIT